LCFIRKLNYLKLHLYFSSYSKLSGLSRLAFIRRRQKWCRSAKRFDRKYLKLASAAISWIRLLEHGTADYFVAFCAIALMFKPSVRLCIFARTFYLIKLKTRASLFVDALRKASAVKMELSEQLYFTVCNKPKLTASWPWNRWK